MNGEAGLTVFYDNPEGGHNPAHFKQVYGELLSKEGVVTKVVYFVKSGVAGKNVVLRGGVGLLETIFRAMLLPIAMYKLQRRLRCFAPGRVVMVHNDPFVMIVSLVLKSLFGGSVIYRITQLKTEEVMQYYSPMFRGVFSIHRWLRNRAVELADHTILMSTSMLQYVYISTSVSLSKLSILESYVDSSGFSTVLPQDVSMKLKKAKLKKGECLVYVGNISQYRDNDFLFDLLDYVKAIRSNVKLLVIASGSKGEVQSFSDLIRVRGVGDSVVLFSNLDEGVMGAVLSSIDAIGLSPYNYGQNRVLICNSPVKTLDYLNSGIYVVASDIPENQSILTDRKLGVAIGCDVIKFGDAVLDAICHGGACSDKQYRRNWVLKNRDVVSNASILAGVVKSLIE